MREASPFGYVTKLDDLPNLATGKPVSYENPWEVSYSASKEQALTDAQLASKRGDHPNWQGFRKINLDVTVDLGNDALLSGVWIRCFQHAGMTRVQFPTSVEVLGSIDGEIYVSLARAEYPLDKSLEARIRKFRLEFPEQSLRYIRFIAINPEILYKGHPREGMDAWIFADELGIE